MHSSSRAKSGAAAIATGLILMGLGCQPALRPEPSKAPFVCIDSAALGTVDAESVPSPRISYGTVAKGLYAPGDGKAIPGTFDFSGLVKQVSSRDPQPVLLKGAWNNYTVGKYGERPGCGERPGLQDQSNFIDPFCDLTDAWFGVYTVLDDEQGLGRRFMLKDAAGPPDRPENLRPEAMMRLTELDQKLIVCISHWGMAGYTWDQFQRDFRFQIDPASVQVDSRPLGGATWKRVAFAAGTIAALPDMSRVQLPKGWFYDYVGVPTDAVYQYVKPWYPVTLRAETYGRYIPCPSGRGIWAVIYFNGATLRTLQGELLDHWTQPLRDQFTRMASEVQVECGR